MATFRVSAVSLTVFAMLSASDRVTACFRAIGWNFLGSASAGTLRFRGPATFGTARPSPSATWPRQRPVDMRQHAHHALADRRRLHLAQLEAEGLDDVLLLGRPLAVPEQRRLAEVVGELLAPLPHLRPVERLRVGHEAPGRPGRPGTGSRRRAMLGS